MINDDNEQRKALDEMLSQISFARGKLMQRRAILPDDTKEKLAALLEQAAQLLTAAYHRSNA